MKLPNNLGLKGYIILFSMTSLSTLLSLLYPEAGTSIYYTSLMVLYPAAGFWFLFALIDAVVSCLVVIALMRRAFNMPKLWVRFFQWIFYLRIVTTLAGHNYEYLVIKSAFLGSTIMGSLTLGVVVLFTFPSFKEHYIYAFKK